MKQCLIAKAAVVLLLVIVFAAPSSALAVEHSIQIFDDQDQPWEGVPVEISIFEFVNGWTVFEGETDETGTFSIDELLEVDPDPLFWEYWADPEVYDGDDWFEGQILYNKVAIILDFYPGGVR